MVTWLLKFQLFVGIDIDATNKRLDNFLRFIKKISWPSKSKVLLKIVLIIIHSIESLERCFSLNNEFHIDVGIKVSSPAKIPMGLKALLELGFWISMLQLEKPYLKWGEELKVQKRVKVEIRWQKWKRVTEQIKMLCKKKGNTKWYIAYSARI